MQEEIKLPTESKKKYKVAIVAPTPFYYHVPLYRRLSLSADVDLTVYYCSDETLRGVEVEKMYHTKGKFGTKENLLGGYRHKIIRNYSLTPSYLKWPFGLINIGICRKIRREKYDIVILQSWTNLTWWLAFFSCLLNGTSVAFMTDENILAKKTKPMWKKIIKRAVVASFIFKFSSGFLTAGSANEELYKYYGVPENKLFRTYFSFGYEQFLVRAEELKLKRNSIRDSLGIKADDFVLLYVGRMSEEKNLFRLLDAYNMVDYPDKKLFFVGGGPLYSDIEKYIKDSGIKGVSLMGFQDREKILDFYAVADVFILPSVYEPWGIVVNEAMCFGLPIIASDRVGAAVDLVREGLNGFTFPAEDEKKLFECIYKFVKMDSSERLIFGQKSSEIINKWIMAIDPAKQIVKIIESKKQ